MMMPRRAYVDLLLPRRARWLEMVHATTSLFLIPACAGMTQMRGAQRGEAPLRFFLSPKNGVSRGLMFRLILEMQATEMALCEC
jgi:hypothetical protein